MALNLPENEHWSMGLDFWKQGKNVLFVTISFIGLICINKYMHIFKYIQIQSHWFLLYYEADQQSPRQ